MSSKIDFNSLLSEIKLKIFSYLSIRSLSKASRVSQEWRALSQDPLLWKGFLCRDFLYYEGEEKKEALVSQSRYMMLNPDFKIFLCIVSDVWDRDYHSDHSLTLFFSDFCSQISKLEREQSGPLVSNIMDHVFKKLPTKVLENQEFYLFYKRSFSKLFDKSDSYKLDIITQNIAKIMLSVFHLPSPYRLFISIGDIGVEQEELAIWSKRTKLRGLFYLHQTWKNFPYLFRRTPLNYALQPSSVSWVKKDPPKDPPNRESWRPTMFLLLACVITMVCLAMLDRMRPIDLQK